jgi:hypothetical protein
MGVKYLNAINRTQKRALLFQSINNQLLNNLYKEGIKVDWQVWFVGILFIVVYGIIISEKIHRTIIALYSYLYSINKGNWSNQSYVNCPFMVGVIVGSLPGWKRNHCRCLGQCYSFRHLGPRRLSDYIFGVYENSISADASIDSY